MNVTKNSDVLDAPVGTRAIRGNHAPGFCAAVRHILTYHGGEVIDEDVGVPWRRAKL
ncbi:MAG: hypothetical protein ACRCSP_07130 [Rhodoglobus sp.]